MQLSHLIDVLERYAPPVYQESYDNTGLLTGNYSMNITGALLSIDCTEEVVKEAMQKNCNLIISHHPIIFHNLKRITGDNYVQRTLISAIKNDMAIYAIHTNLDNVVGGVNAKIAEKLKLKNTRILSAKSGLLKKLVTFVPVEQAAQVRQALFNAGAGHIGHYSHCSFNVEGIGTFKGGKGTKPFVGQVQQDHHETENKLEVVFPAHLQSQILSALLSAHPYEEVAYDLVQLDNAFSRVGAGLIGELEKETTPNEMFKHLKEVFHTPTIKHSKIIDKNLKTIAVCGGSGSFLLPAAMAQQADMFISADFKYHEFFDADNRLIIADIGHYESEQFTTELINDILRQKFPNFALHFSEVKTNPVNYF